MSFGQSISYCLSNYTNFNGRGSRSEFWWFLLAAFIFQVVVQGLLNLVFGGNTFGTLLSLVVAVAVAIPLYAASGGRGIRYRCAPEVGP